MNSTPKWLLTALEVIRLVAAALAGYFAGGN